jgi:hypothetical protein
MLLTSMLEYDDCSAQPAIPHEVFSRELISYAKKNNIFKDAK